MNMKIDFTIEHHLSTEEFRNILLESTLGERRPVDDPERLQSMLKNSNLVITARYQGRLIGIARSITDQVYATYLSDLAVSKEFQKMGIGKELIRRTKLSTPQAKLILLSAPAAIGYYPKIGMTNHANCFILDNPDDLL
jgi:predicted N-acetyltransferase YhbS